eukprot:TRINITY_DN71948_c0_g1_i2.p1 TRINITY_DN71948_c0_g1~~TRINITY_DN71948_c0_g1_i2.p1  ORF type:complete len:523 (-),score=80.45 TRINITY_DN71948_c0_g1_i2:95-1663(-)
MISGNELGMELWLHPSHGCQASELVPLASVWGDAALPVEAVEMEAARQAVYSHGAVSSSAAEGMGCEPASSSGDPQPGVPCVISGSNLCVVVDTETGGQWAPVASIFLSAISCHAISHEPSDWVLIVLIPAHYEGGLKTITERGVASPSCWIVLCHIEGGFERRWDVMQTFSNAGGLRTDMEKWFEDSSSMIGGGAYAKVFTKRDILGNTHAVKAMNESVDVHAIEREVEMLITVQPHDHIVQYRGMFLYRQEEMIRLTLSFEVAPYGDLLRWVIGKNWSFEEEDAKGIFVGIMLGLRHIHDAEIVHRDMKPENILLLSARCPAIADFGLATRITDQVQMARRCGSPGYVAPEVCLGNPYGFKVDTFGVGVVLYFMLSGEMPFSSADRDTAAAMRNTVKCSLHLRQPPWDTKTSYLRNMLRLLICKSPDARLGAMEALQHSWLRSYGANVGGAAPPAAPQEAAAVPAAHEEAYAQAPPPAPDSVVQSQPPLPAAGYPPEAEAGAPWPPVPPPGPPPPHAYPQ